MNLEKAHPNTILIAEDSIENQALVRRAVEKVFESPLIHTVDNGEDALHVMRDVVLDGVILDNRMPKMWGVDVLKEYAKHKREAEGVYAVDTPKVILHTSDQFETIHQEAAKLVQNGILTTFISKNGEIEDLLEAIHLLREKDPVYAECMARNLAEKTLLNAHLTRENIKQLIAQMYDVIDIRLLTADQNTKAPLINPSSLGFSARESVLR